MSKNDFENLRGSWMALVRTGLPWSPQVTVISDSGVQPRWTCEEGFVLPSSYPGSSQEVGGSGLGDPGNSANLESIFVFFFFFFAISRAAPGAYGGSQARCLIRAVAVSLHQSHSNL